MHPATNRSVPCLFTIMLLLAVASHAAAQVTHDVDVGPGLDFAPADLTIALGDTVRWTWQGGSHNVESGVGGVHDGNFTSGAPTPAVGTVYEVIFDDEFLKSHPMPDDVYPYYCINHFGLGMVGQITVGIDDCPADLNGDNLVNVLDLLLLLTAWGPNPGDPADLNGDGNVDVVDLLQMLTVWGAC